jgi:RHS repeat-associated protein
MERDEETGLEYHSARYYLPWLGRWLSADSIGIEGGINLYAYVNNSPTQLTDPDGNDSKLTQNFEQNGWTYKSQPGLVFFLYDAGQYAIQDIKTKQLYPVDNKNLSIIVSSGVPILNYLDEALYEVPENLLNNNPGEISSAGTRWNASGPRQFYKSPVAVHRAMRGYDKTGRLDYTENADIWEAGHGCAGCHIEFLTNGPPTNEQLDLNRYTRVAMLTKVASDFVSTAVGGYDPRNPTTIIRMGIPSPKMTNTSTTAPPSGGGGGKGGGSSSGGGNSGGGSTPPAGGKPPSGGSGGGKKGGGGDESSGSTPPTLALSREVKKPGALQRTAQVVKSSVDAAKRANAKANELFDDFGRWVYIKLKDLFKK